MFNVGTKNINNEFVSGFILVVLLLLNVIVIVIITFNNLKTKSQQNYLTFFQYSDIIHIKLCFYQQQMITVAYLFTIQI